MKPRRMRRMNQPSLPRNARGLLFRTIANVLFTITWSAVLYGVIHAFVMLWRRDAKFARWCALAIAGAFALGSGSPFVIGTLAWAIPQSAPPPGVVPTSSAAAAPAAASVAPFAALPAGAVRCPVGRTVPPGSARGHLDTVTIDDVATTLNGTIDVPASKPVRLAGWAIAGKAPDRAACVVVDGSVVPSAGTYGLDRPDVAAALNAPGALKSGFNQTVIFTAGAHHVGVAVLDARGATIALPATVTVNAR